MEITNKNDFIDIYVLKTLSEIKFEVKQKIELKSDLERQTDEKMKLVLKDLINANFNSFTSVNKSFNSIAAIEIPITSILSGPVRLLSPAEREQIIFGTGICIKNKTIEIIPLMVPIFIILFQFPFSPPPQSVWIPHV